MSLVWYMRVYFGTLVFRIWYLELLELWYLLFQTLRPLILVLELWR